MTDTNFATKHRARTLDDVVGQEAVVSEIRGMFKRKAPAQSVLLSGTRGNGKTTLARIYARMLNELADDEPFGPDLYEINAASERGIDNVRKLSEQIKFAPLRCKFRTIIADEMHMMTKEAFTALLKPLEEPPPHVAWILVTNEPHKLPQTVLDRCRHFRLDDVTPEAVKLVLRRVCKAEKVFCPTKADENRAILNRIAELCGGNPRQALTLLQKAADRMADTGALDLDELERFIEGDAEQAAVTLTALIYRAAADKAARKNSISLALKHLAQVKDHAALIRVLIDLNTFLLDKSAGVWTYPSFARKKLSGFMREKGLDVSDHMGAAIRYHAALAELQQRSLFGGVDVRALTTATILKMLGGLK